MKLTYDERVADGKIRIGCTDKPMAGHFHGFQSPAIVDTDIDGLKAIAFSEYWEGAGVKPKQVYLLVPVETIKRKVINKKVPKELRSKAAIDEFLSHPDNVIGVRTQNGKRS